MHKLMSSLLILSSIFLTSSVFGDVNILIIGSEYDSSKVFWTEKSRAFKAAKIRAELENILNGAGVGTANVVYEDRYKYHSGYETFNFASWFHWPYPAGSEVERWKNLRGKGGTQWDYVILIGDSFTIEQMPGLYTHGVAKVAEEVAKGANGAETVLLMPWPAAVSDSTVAHYKEVVYRTGRSGGFKVAPAGLAWQDAGSPADGYTSTDKGAYLAAATLYSRLWNKSAKESSYTFDDALADTVHATVTANVGAQQYTGKWSFQSPFKCFDYKYRKVSHLLALRGSSTERLNREGNNNANRRSKIQTSYGPGVYGPSISVTHGRDAYNPTGDKDYRNRGTGYAFGYRFPSEGGNIDSTLANIFSQDITLAKRMIGESNNYRINPHRLLLGSLLQVEPGITINAGGHTYERATAIGSYDHTIISGRCSVDSKLADVIPNSKYNHDGASAITTKEEYDLLAQMVGYKMAWNVSRLQVRAPGFKVSPSSANKVLVGPGNSETMTVEFLLPPEHPVTVNVSVANSAAVTVSPQTLTFTPANYQIPQQVTVTAKADSPPTSEFDVAFNTTSQDVVYNELYDSWRYAYNTPPEAVASVDKPSIVMPEYSSVFAAVAASDAEGDSLSYTWSKVSGPDGVTFLPSWSRSPIVAFTNPGTYVLRVAVSDSKETSTSEVTVTVEGTYGGVNPNAGLWFGRVTGERNTTTPNPKTTTLTDLAQETENSLPKIMTEIYTGQIYDEDGIISFRESFYGGASFHINGVKVFEGLTRTATETSGVLTLTPGWNDIEIRVWSPSGKSGYRLGFPAIGYDPDGGGWRTLVDSGDGSFLRKVQSTNVAPTASNGSANTDEDVAVAINLFASDADGDPLTYSFTQPSNGALSGTAPNLTYTPAPGFFGNDSFTFTANDGTVNSNVATVSLTVNEVIPVPQGIINFNDHPILSYAGSQDSSGTATVEDGGATLQLTGNRWKAINFPYTVTANTVLEFDFRSSHQGEIHGIGFDTDRNLSSESFFQVYGTQPWGIGTFKNYSGTATKRYVIPVGENFTGTFQYLFFAMDDDNTKNGDSVFSNVKIYEAETEPNTAPVANNSSVTTDQDTATSVTISASDADGDTLTYSIVSGPANGSLSGSAPNLTYTPTPGFHGIDLITFKVNDGTEDSNTATVSITVNEVSQDSINFNDHTILSYGGSKQDLSGTATIEDNGATLHLNGNRWKAINFPYTVTANTVLEFDFRSSHQGEIHGIGFDTDRSLSSESFFQVYGTQPWGIGTFINYSGTATKRYVIPVGEHITGTFQYLFFAMDDDRTKDGDSVFSNVKIYEAGSSAETTTAIASESVTSAKVETALITGDSSISIGGNGALSDDEYLQLGQTIDLLVLNEGTFTMTVTAVSGTYTFNLNPGELFGYSIISDTEFDVIYSTSKEITDLLDILFSDDEILEVKFN